MIKKYVPIHIMGVLYEKESVQYIYRNNGRWVLSIPDGDDYKNFIVRMLSELSATRNTFEYKWDPLTFRIIDYIGDANFELFQNWMNCDNVTTNNNYKKDLILGKLDPTGSVVQKWILIGTTIFSYNHQVYWDNEVGDTEITIISDTIILQ